MLKSARLMVLAILACAIAASADDGQRGANHGDNVSTPPPHPPSPIERTTWWLYWYRAENAAAKSRLRPATGTDKRPVMSLRDGRLTIETGCQRLAGSYSIDGERLTVLPTLLPAPPPCSASLAQQERQITAALSETASFQLRGTTLRLFDTETRPLLQFNRSKPTRLFATAWRLTDLAADGDMLAASALGPKITLEFFGDRQLGGHDGCNRYLSGYVLTENRLAIGPIATTRMACQTPPEIATQARTYARALGRVGRFRQNAETLLLLTDQGQPLARFTRTESLTR